MNSRLVRDAWGHWVIEMPELTYRLALTTDPALGSHLLAQYGFIGHEVVVSLAIDRAIVEIRPCPKMRYVCGHPIDVTGPYCSNDGARVEWYYDRTDIGEVSHAIDPTAVPEWT